MCESLGRLPSTPSPTVLSSRRVPKSECSPSMPFPLRNSPEPSLVASYQTYPLYPTTILYPGESPRTSSVELTFLVAVRTDSWPSRGGSESPLRGSGSRSSRKTARSRLAPSSPTCVARRSFPTFPQILSPPSVGTKFRILLENVASHGAHACMLQRSIRCNY